MPTNWYGEQRLAEIRQAAATDLLRAATFFANQHSLRISRPNPPPYRDSSKPGEYLKLRTGFGRSNLAMEPTSPAEVVRTMQVKVGFRRNAWYMLYWSEQAHSVRLRLGLLQTLNDLQPQLAALATASFQR